jgi:PTH1 family peptidyl-tRNA hydrolase
MSKDARITGGNCLIVGLGNPGSKYARTRHNIGFMVVEELGRRWSIEVNKSKFKAVYGKGPIGTHSATLLLPQTFMNLSGESVGAAAHFLRLEPGSVIALHDDIDLAAGAVRLKLGGGHGGHNGLRSMDAHLPDKNYFRVRLGVGRAPGRTDVAAWVLSDFRAVDAELVGHLVSTGADAVELLLREGLAFTQNEIHARPF